MNRRYLFYVLVEPTGAGDEPLAVSKYRSELVDEQLNHPEITPIHEIGFDEYVDTMLYLGYAVHNELHTWGFMVEKDSADYAERQGNVEKRQVEREISYRGFYTNPDGKELYRDFKTEKEAYEWAIADRYSVIRDLQGGAFGTGRHYTIEEWREQAIDWLTADDAEEETISVWKKMPAKDIIREVELMWDLEIVKCKNS